MIALRIRFRAGALHANPWERRVVADEMEWPPAPWRLMCVVAEGWRRAGEPERSMFGALLDQLAEPPIFLLPRAMAGPSRHRVALRAAKHTAKRSMTVCDSFIALDNGNEAIATAYALWPIIQPSTAERELLASCCSAIDLRSEWRPDFAIDVIDEISDESALERVDLASRSNRDGPSVRRVAVAAAVRGERLLRALAEPPVMGAESGQVIAASTSVEYRLPADFLMVREQYDRKERTEPVFGPILLRFTLGAGKRRRKPVITDAVVFAELLRAAAIEHISKREGEPATLRLAGKSATGAPNEGHGHPYFLPFDGRGVGEIDGIDIWFPQGCTHPEYRAIVSIATLYERELYHDDFPLSFVGTVTRPRGRTWTCVTPVVLDRFPKSRGSKANPREVDSPEDQIAAMTKRLTGSTLRVEVWSDRSIGVNGARVPITAFRRTRPHKQMPPFPSAAATLQFDEPVEGPIVLGRLAHFGLGRFESS